MPDREQLIELAAVEIADYLPHGDPQDRESRGCAERVVAALLAALRPDDEAVERAWRYLHEGGPGTQGRKTPGWPTASQVGAALEAAGPVVVERSYPVEPLRAVLDRAAVREIEELRAEVERLRAFAEQMAGLTEKKDRWGDRFWLDPLGRDTQMADVRRRARAALDEGREG